MRTKSVLLGVCALFIFWAVAIGSAQTNQNLQITNGPTVEHTDSNSAVIAWSTNTNGSTLLKYGSDPNSLTQTAQAPWGGVTHRVTIHNLQPNTTYYFQVESSQGQGSGTGAISTVSQFKTTNGPAASNSNGQSGATNNAQVIAGPIPQQVTANSATIYWQTTQPTANIVKYGTAQNALTQTAQTPYGGQTHRVQLSNLQPGTTYYFAIEQPNGTQVSTGQFQTQGQNSGQTANNVQITNGPNVDYVASNQAKVSWSTNAASSSVVKYGTDPNALNRTAEAPWGGTNHQVTLNNLNPNTQYYFQIQSGQGQGTGTMASSNAYSFRTVQNGQAAMTMQH